VKCRKCELFQIPLCQRCDTVLVLQVSPPVEPISLRQAERDLIERTIAKHPVPVAAQMLGVSCRTLYRKVLAHKLKAPAL